MTAVDDTAPLASFEAKWGAAHPELGLGFVAAAQRRAQTAFACIACEIEHAAFAIRAAEPALIKLQWWAEELARAGRGEARHPLTQALAEHPELAALPPAQWHAVVAGAFAQRDPEPAAAAGVEQRREDRRGVEARERHEVDRAVLADQRSGEAASDQRVILEGERHIPSMAVL